LQWPVTTGVSAKEIGQKQIFSKQITILASTESFHSGDVGHDVGIDLQRASGLQAELALVPEERVGLHGEVVVTFVDVHVDDVVEFKSFCGSVGGVL